MSGFARCSAAVAAVVVASLAAVPTVRGELLEEIVANVNGDIITLTDLENEEQQMLAEAYRRFTGEELDRSVRTMKARLLVEMIDRRILLDRALAMFSNVEDVKNMYYEGFKKSQNVEDDAEFARMLEKDGLTVDDFKQRLLEIYAPEEVLRVEVGNRIAVSSAEVERYYEEHPADFAIEDQVTVREIVLLVDDEGERAEKLAEAEAIVARVRGGGSFAEAAEAHSDAGTKTAGGLLGTVKRGHLAEALEEVAFELAAGDVSAPIETPYGYHILLVESRTVGEKSQLDA
ncbi:MAG TPA: peptidylprolyl isomerase, partial [Candidatus Polarisedimenticolaceae bacterium]|nr:peptidylprolyl isomerase [Candidatus Polarisedimenticolaceae bacterium]